MSWKLLVTLLGVAFLFVYAWNGHQDRFMNKCLNMMSTEAFQRASIESYRSPSSSSANQVLNWLEAIYDVDIVACRSLP
ncbi:hypothetical protein CR162_13010 [Pseudoroseomonas rhizosphaerae]|uniref:Uncharacterized protein n=1 Tax=Teichococcus rhizosphaerae TaxID=1335062 RepID=A0A2C7ABF1_9PROT|nr:hypothetical protein CR162_13010 [Pseudoroseomonas rhizosphaerae]